jgi:hypothetical protein
MQLQNYTASVLVAIALSIFFFVPDLQAEPWLSNRYAQNCAACHSPGRRNVEYTGRRCTATCQGCHVSPNGGGLRSEYGVWTQQRFLRSFRNEFFHNKGTPAPAKYQKYGDMPVQYAGGTKSRSGQTFDEMAKTGAPLVVLPGVDYNEKMYDRSDKQDQLLVASREEFLARLTDDDPFRIEHRQSVFAGGDFRYFYFNGTKTYKNNSSPNVTQRFFAPMALDIGVKVRPIPEKVSLVFEARSFNTPSASTQDWEWTSEGGITPKSTYVLIDDLPYNTYVTAGLYKPLFGYTTADHTSLLNTLMYADNTFNSSSEPNDAFDFISARSGEELYKAITVGGAPGGATGKFFYSVNYIMPTEQQENVAFNRESGYSANLGARFVPFGSSIMFSYWSTKGPRGVSTGPNLENTMMSVSGGFMYNRLIVNADYTRITREYLPGQSDTGSVLTIDPKYRIWREVYGFANYANANTANNLKQGSSTSLSVGLKAYTMTGTEVELSWINRIAKDTVNDLQDTGNLLLGQLHLYF